ncbi:MAG: NAD-binding protein [Candidatus Erginobacter occultus]|nr:NAD-binding protein [Candidatus Erginobacter occultus]
MRFPSGPTIERFRFLQGDGSDPKVLKEVNPDQTDVLFCLTDDDRVNLIAGLVGRSLNFKRVIPSIREPAFDVICRELGLQDTVLPSLTVSRYLADMARGINTMELSSIIKGEARFFTFSVSRDDEVVVMTHSRNLKALIERWGPQALEKV